MRFPRTELYVTLRAAHPVPRACHAPWTTAVTNGHETSASPETIHLVIGHFRTWQINWADCESRRCPPLRHRTTAPPVYDGGGGIGRPALSSVVTRLTTLAPAFARWAASAALYSTGVSSWRSPYMPAFLASLI